MGIEYRMDHVAISVADLDRSVEWYHSMFGFQERLDCRFGGEGSPYRGTMLDLHGFGVEVFEALVDPQDMPEHERDFYQNLRAKGVKHFALRVDDLEAARNDLRAKGGDLGDIVNGSTTRYFTVTDPDGIQVEIKQPYGEVQ